MVDSDTFRQVMGNFAAGVTVVTLPDPAHGITVNAFASVSLDPPLVLVCLDHDSEAFRRFEEGADRFCVNVLAADQRHLGEYFANMGDLETDPFETEATRTAATGAPVFEDAIAYLDCTVAASHEAGDHTIYVGSVEDAAIQRADAPALTYFRGGWGSFE